MGENQDPLCNVSPKTGVYDLLYSPYSYGRMKCKITPYRISCDWQCTFQEKELTLKLLPKSEQNSPKTQTGVSQDKWLENFLDLFYCCISHRISL